MYDITFLGHYTKDTIVSASGTRIVDGGAVFYGANVASRMGLRTAVVTRLSREDFRVVEQVEKLGVRVFAKTTPKSTCLRLEYPSSNLDERVIRVTSKAGPFAPEEVKHIETRALVIGGSMRDEISLRVMKKLAHKTDSIAVDAQSFVRIDREGTLVSAEWPEKQAVFAIVQVLKADAVEAELLTGSADIRVAAKILYELGPREIVLTHRDGVMVYDGDQFHEAGFFPKKIVGRSGRGDTCIASYVASRLNASPEEATIWAAAVTSLKMEAEGPFRRDIVEVERLIDEKY
ncbi:MAG: PfkB family carbohydrate kinase [Thermodesulfobacteriota bacterium]